LVGEVGIPDDRRQPGFVAPFEDEDAPHDLGVTEVARGVEVSVRATTIRLGVGLSPRSGRVEVFESLEVGRSEMSSRAMA